MQPRPGIGLARKLESLRVFALGDYDRLDLQLVFGGELIVALIVCRAAEDGAGAIVHQHEIGNVDRELGRLLERMSDLQPGVIAFLLGALDVLGRRAHAMAFVDEFLQRLVLLRQFCCQRMIGRDGEKRHAEDGVRPGGEHLQLLEAFRQCLAFDSEAHQQAFGFADPVALHQPHLVRPAIERVERRQQVVGIFGDLQKPLAQLALLDQGTRPPAAPIYHLLIGQHSMIYRVPVDFALLAIDQTLLEELHEQALLLGVIFHIAGRKFAAPIERQAHALELGTHRGDVLIRPGLRVHLALDGRVLRRQAKGVPAHRMQDVEATRALIAGEHVAHHIVAHMADVDAPRRIGEHLEHIIFRLGGIFLGAVDFLPVPNFAPMLFAFRCVISFGGHD